MSAINIFGVNCSSLDCPDGGLGAMTAQSADCANVYQSEVNSLVWWHPTGGSTGTPTNITNWGATLATSDFDIDNADATDVKQKRIFGVGDMPSPEFSSVTVNNFNTVDIAGTWTLNFDIYDVGSSSYDYLRKLECSKVKPQFVFTTVGGKIYGDADGITPTQFRLSPVLERGEESIEKWVLTITWKSQTAPDRYDNPLP